MATYDDVEIFEMMPTIICEQSLRVVRRFPGTLPEWYEGRAASAALIHPTPFNIGAANEIRFLNGDYLRRHYK